MCNRLPLYAESLRFGIWSTPSNPNLSYTFSGKILACEPVSILKSIETDFGPIHDLAKAWLTIIFDSILSI